MMGVSLEKMTFVIDWTLLKAWTACNPDLDRLKFLQIFWHCSHIFVILCFKQRCCRFCAWRLTYNSFFKADKFLFFLLTAFKMNFYKCLEFIQVFLHAFTVDVLRGGNISILTLSLPQMARWNVWSAFSVSTFSHKKFKICVQWFFLLL